MEKIVLYPGTFDPVTLGHLDVMKLASKIFDKLIVGMLINPQKKPRFSKEERQKMINDSLRDYRIENARVIFFNGLTVDLAKREGAIAIVRGLRLVMDFEAELDISFNNAMLSGIPTIFIPPTQKHIHIRSSTVREFLDFGRTQELKKYVPTAVFRFLTKK